MRCLKAVVAFFTAFPVGGAELDFSCVWAAPYLAGLAVGGAGGAVYLLTHSPAAAYAALLLATGLHHLDGLADVGDALMVRDRERARRVLEDPRRGVGGIFAVAALFVLAASAKPGGWLDYVAADVYSKALTLAVAAPSRPFKEGLGSLFIAAARRQWPGALLALAAAAWLHPAAFLAATALSLAFYAAAYRHLGGANGDLMGALLEVSRALYLVSL
ncbi:adenosylcobinamide-GDP ribazoletransferase [Pyrobaculum neutrophilum]|uniref:Adenosylcobinamide-GDP ribazoletransferase n=1 Tax=Pyrobaculum neutrophilum (strain DSM 2338 / JCM 9278 / NBRC 100436 / V24Sta) TaxID=444157 RepID=B1YBB0_PYRNV|nr:adenosylcobinamide-GDP ribazoletransferase [Pyrobaculum neutrophilum]ACB39241.1 cobalamin 5'-phosphate synthase [Pyrobaculum neutrophilum V24Sta]